MIKEIQFQRANQIMYAMDENYEVVGSWECRDDFVAGTNDEGQARASLPDGVHANVSAELGNFGAPYGTFYIETNDYRERDIHGGGSGLPDSFAPYQGWVPTLGCLRMQNADGEELAQMIIDSADNGIQVTLTVV